MHKVVESTSFQDMESRKYIDLKDVLNQPEKKKESTQNLKTALDQALSENISKLNPKLSQNVDLTEQIKLVVASQ